MITRGPEHTDVTRRSRGEKPKGHACDHVAWQGTPRGTRRRAVFCEGWCASRLPGVDSSPRPLRGGLHTVLVRPAWSRCCATSCLGVPLSFRCSIRHWGVGMSRVVRVAPGRRTAPVVASAKGASRLHATFFVHEALCAQCTLASLGHALGFHPWRPQAHFAVESVVRRVCAGVICKCSIGPTHVMTEQDSKTASEGVRMHRKCLDKTPLHPPRSS